MFYLLGGTHSGEALGTFEPPLLGSPQPDPPRFYTLGGRRPAMYFTGRAPPSSWGLFIGGEGLS